MQKFRQKVPSNYAITLFIIILLANKALLSKNPCSCSNINDNADTKCILQSNVINYPNCSIVFQQTSNDLSQSSGICLGQNTFSTLGEYPGQLRKIVIQCTASYPLDINFDGMLPHQSIGITFHRFYKTVSGSNLTSFITVSMDVEPEITGNYTIFGKHNQDLWTSLYIFAESGKDGPYLMNNGKTLNAKVDDGQIILPCRVLNPSVQVLVRKKGTTSLLNLPYNPKIGFLIDLKDPILGSVSTEYECFVQENPAISRVTIEVNLANNSKVINQGLQLSSEVESNLDFNVSGKWVVCTSINRNIKNYRLVNMRTSNPSESRMKESCLHGEIECLGKREGSFNRCYSTPRYCKSVDFKEGGGIISCFIRTSEKFSKPYQYLLGLDGNTYLNPETGSVPTKALININATNNAEEGFYTGIPYNFSCTAVRYLIALPLHWYLILKNESVIPLEYISDPFELSSKIMPYNNYKTETTVVFNNTEVAGVMCMGFSWDSEQGLNLTHLTDIQESITPRFKVNSVSVQFYLGQTNHLECDAEALPKPNIEWKKGDQKIMGTAMSNRTLYISNTKLKDGGTYVCVASSELGSASKLFYVEVIEPDVGPAYWVTVGVPILILVICVIVSAALIKYYKRSRRGLSRQEISEFKKGAAQSENKSADLNNYEGIANAIPYSKEYEITDGKYEIDQDSLLGSGAYGSVYKGSIDGHYVAIKTIKHNAEVSYLKALLAELKVMIYLKEHPNIVNLIGANTKHLNRGAVYIMVELCPLGNLENYLRSHRHGFVDQFRPRAQTNYVNNPFSTSNFEIEGYSNPAEILSSTDLVNWSYQISNGMEYLGSKYVIHGDLAARNVLLFDKQTVKISDFGLSRKMYAYSAYVKTSQDPLPWKNLALESLRDLTFTLKSDVWAYGVTLFEIFSLGEVPYPGLTWNVDFVQDIENGLRMSMAKFSNNEIYDLQLECWTNDPSERPTFTFISNFFENLLRQLNRSYEM